MPKLKIKQEISKSKERKPRIKADAPDTIMKQMDHASFVSTDNIKENQDYFKQILRDPTAHYLVTPTETKSMTPAELNLKLRDLYHIPIKTNRNEIQWYLDMIPYAVEGTTEEKMRANMKIENHKYFLRRYAINGKEFDVCWLLLQEGV